MNGRRSSTIYRRAEKPSFCRLPHYRHCQTGFDQKSRAAILGALTVQVRLERGQERPEVPVQCS
jgi:hypothetical protein